MLEPTHRLQELAGWLLLLFSFIWLAGFSLLSALMDRILTRCRGENRLSRMIAWLDAAVQQVLQETTQPEQIGAWLSR